MTGQQTQFGAPKRLYLMQQRTNTLLTVAGKQRLDFFWLASKSGQIGKDGRTFRSKGDLLRQNSNVASVSRAAQRRFRVLLPAISRGKKPPRHLAPETMQGGGTHAEALRAFVPRGGKGQTGPGGVHSQYHTGKRREAGEGLGSMIGTQHKADADVEPQSARAFDEASQTKLTAARVGLCVGEACPLQTKRIAVRLIDGHTRLVRNGTVQLRTEG